MKVQRNHNTNFADGNALFTIIVVARLIIYVYLCNRIGINPMTLKTLVDKKKNNEESTPRGRKPLLPRSVIEYLIEIAKLHDDHSEGLQRKQMISKIIKASGGKLSVKQETNMCQRTIHPAGFVFYCACLLMLCS